MQKIFVTTLSILSVLAVGSASFAKDTSVQTRSSAHIKQCVRPADDGASLYIWDWDNLEKIRANINAKDASVMPSFEALILRADKELAKAPYSVVLKTKTPDSGDKHDYYSVGPYWWPDPKKSDGLPYIRKDGDVNPERHDNSLDSVRMSDFSTAVTTLALASHYTHNKAYANKAAEFVRAWFLEPETRMNPNMNHAQAIPGRSTGRGIGIIDSYGLVKVVDSLGLLEHSGALSEDDVKGLKRWFRDYSIWMLTSENGKDERKQVNNHGIFYDAQLMVFSAYAGDMGAVELILDGVKESRIPNQINAKGQLPLELKRTRAFHYTSYTLRAFFDAADIAECVGVDLWNYEMDKGQTLKSAIAYQTSYADDLSKWPYKELRKKVKTSSYYEIMLRARSVYPDIDFTAAMATYSKEHERNYVNLVHP